MKSKNITHLKGFTLIELIVVIALLGIITSALLAFFSYSNNTYNRGIEQSNIQSDIRLASSQVVEELRYATEIKILNTFNQNWIDDPISSIATYDNYIFFYDNQIVIQGRYHRESYTIGPSGTITFNGTDGNVLDVTVQGVSNGQDYDILTEVEPLNLDLVTGNIDITNGNVGSIIMYRTANDYLSLKALPEALIGTNTDPENITVSFSKELGTVEIVDEFTVPSNPSGYSITKPDATHLAVAITGGAVAGTRVTIMITLNKYEDGIFIEFYYTLFFDGTEWSIL